MNLFLKRRLRSTLASRAFRRTKIPSLYLVFASSIFVFSLLVGYANGQTSKSRHFILNYSFTVKIENPGKPLDIWFPMPRTDQYQTVKILSKDTDIPVTQATEPEYANRMFYAHLDKADKPEYHFSVKYDIYRREQRSGTTGGRPPHKELARFLQADRLVPTTGKLADLARQQVAPGMGEMEKARAMYDYVFSTMRYDKTGSGWGRGDALWACDTKRGNCTDFHSVFISMMRSQRIPTKFEIGFPLPEDKSSSAITTYHCWAEFYTRHAGWVPVDISEAWKHPASKDYFFGALDANRVQFSVGRDLELAPKQHGEPLNYFIYPYVESDGRVSSNVTTAFGFQDVEIEASEKASR